MSAPVDIFCGSAIPAQLPEALSLSDLCWLTAIHTTSGQNWADRIYMRMQRRKWKKFLPAHRRTPCPMISSESWKTSCAKLIGTYLRNKNFDGFQKTITLKFWYDSLFESIELMRGFNETLYLKFFWEPFTQQFKSLNILINLFEIYFWIKKWLSRTSNHNIFSTNWLVKFNERLK